MNHPPNHPPTHPSNYCPPNKGRFFSSFTYSLTNLKHFERDVRWVALDSGWVSCDGR